MREDFAPTPYILVPDWLDLVNESQTGTASETDCVSEKRSETEACWDMSTKLRFRVIKSQFLNWKEVRILLADPRTNDDKSCPGRIYVFHKRVEIRHKTTLPLRHKRHTLYLNNLLCGYDAAII